MNTEILPPAPKPIALRTLLMISGLFWVYVTLSNVLYATNMSVNAALFHADAMYAPWEVRVVQHVLLLPLLLDLLLGVEPCGLGDSARSAATAVVGGDFRRTVLPRNESRHPYMYVVLQGPLGRAFGGS